jgi:hypothetical protein
MVIRILSLTEMQALKNIKSRTKNLREAIIEHCKDRKGYVIEAACLKDVMIFLDDMLNEINEIERRELKTV